MREYTVLLHYDEDQTGYHYLVEIPALNGYTRASNIEEAVLMGIDYIVTASHQPVTISVDYIQKLQNQNYIATIQCESV